VSEEKKKADLSPTLDQIGRLLAGATGTDVEAIIRSGLFPFLVDAASQGVLSSDPALQEKFGACLGLPIRKVGEALPERCVLCGESRSHSPQK
jgi:hypothetical protein